MDGDVTRDERIKRRKKVETLKKKKKNSKKFELSKLEKKIPFEEET